MGNWCCCFQNSDYCAVADGGSEETQRILDHAVGINDGDHRDLQYGSTSQPNLYGNQINAQSSNHQHNISGNNNFNSAKLQQQSDQNYQNQLYQNVLDRLTSRVIDIAAIEKSCEQVDFTDREQAYRDKLMAIRRTVILPSNSTAPIPGAEYLPKNCDPMPMDDYKFITEMAIKLNSAIEEGFKINCDEPFVVNFDT